VVLRGCLSALFGGKFARHLTRPFRARVTVDGEVWARDDFMAVSAACVEQIGLGFKPYYRWNERAGAFPILGFHTASAFGFAVELPRILRGRPVRRDKVIDAVAADALLEHDGELAVGPRVTFVRLSGQVAE
jgi:diacylglycerol kinase family enzyme